MFLMSRLLSTWSCFQVLLSLTDTTKCETAQSRNVISVLSPRLDSGYLCEAAQTQFPKQLIGICCSSCCWRRRPTQWNMTSLSAFIYQWWRSKLQTGLFPGTVRLWCPDARHGFAEGFNQTKTSVKQHQAYLNSWCYLFLWQWVAANAKLFQQSKCHTCHRNI